MKKPKRQSDLVKKLAVKATTGRAQMYLWVRKNYDDITVARTKLRSTWDDIAKEAEAVGQKNARGGPPQAEALRQTFMRVTAELEAATAETRLNASEPKPEQAVASGSVKRVKRRNFIVSSPRKGI